jgi:hypothetical protein
MQAIPRNSDLASLPRAYRNRRRFARSGAGIAFDVDRLRLYLRCLHGGVSVI